MRSGGHFWSRDEATPSLSSSMVFTAVGMRYVPLPPPVVSFDALFLFSNFVECCWSLAARLFHTISFLLVFDYLRFSFPVARSALLSDFSCAGIHVKTIA